MDAADIGQYHLAPAELLILQEPVHPSGHHLDPFQLRGPGGDVAGKPEPVDYLRLSQQGVQLRPGAGIPLFLSTEQLGGLQQPYPVARPPDPLQACPVQRRGYQQIQLSCRHFYRVYDCGGNNVNLAGGIKGKYPLWHWLAGQGYRGLQ